LGELIPPGEPVRQGQIVPLPSRLRQDQERLAPSPKGIQIRGQLGYAGDRVPAEQLQVILDESSDGPALTRAQP